MLVAAAAAAVCAAVAVNKVNTEEICVSELAGAAAAQ